MYCWGYGGCGQLGTGDTANKSQPSLISTSTHFSDIALGSYYSCGISETQTSILCWGKGNPTPTEIYNGTNISAIALGEEHACAIVSGLVYCWGGNGWGQLGIGSTESQVTPNIRIKDPLTDTLNSGTIGGSTISELWDGGYNTFVRTSHKQELYGVGSIDMCQVSGASGYGDPSSYLTQMTISAEQYSSPIAVGFQYACGIKATNLYCWGYNSRGQLGIGSANVSYPYYINGGTSIDSSYFGGYPVYAVSAGYEHTCAIAGGNFYCWGENSYGQLGDGSATPRYTPTLVNFGEVLEICGDGLDNDGDGDIDEDCGCNSETTGFEWLGNSCNAGDGVCQTTGKYGSSASVVDCSAVPDLSKQTTEICDGLDNDCDGEIDEDFGNKGTSCSVGEGICLGEGHYVCSEDKLSTVCDAKVAKPECWNVTPEDLSNDNDKDGITKPYDPDIQNPPAVNNFQKPLQPLAIKTGRYYKLYFQWFMDFIDKLSSFLEKFSLQAVKKGSKVKKNEGVGVKIKVVEKQRISSSVQADRKLAQCQKSCQRLGCRCKKVRDRGFRLASFGAKRGYIVRKTTTKLITNNEIQNRRKMGRIPNEFKVRVRKNCSYKVNYRVVYINKRGRAKNLSPESKEVEF